MSWRIGYTASELISRGEVPPFVIVGIDNPGPMRSLNYLPYAPGTGAGGFRGDAARWPGGGVEQYMGRVIHEVLPMVTDKVRGRCGVGGVAWKGWGRKVCMIRAGLEAVWSSTWGESFMRYCPW